MNKAMLIGNVGQISEIKQAGNAQVINFSIATKDGKDTTTWHRCIAFNKTAETLAQYVSKGDRLYVEGKIQNREWEKDGEKRTNTEIVVNAFEFLTTKKEKEQAEPHAEPSAEIFQSDDVLPF